MIQFKEATEQIRKSKSKKLTLRQLLALFGQQWRGRHVTKQIRAGQFRADTAAQVGYFSVMSKAEIVEELAKLTPAERDEIRLKLAELDGNDWLDEDDSLTDGEKALLNARLVAYEKDPDAGSSWEEVEARIRARLKG